MKKNKNKTNRKVSDKSIKNISGGLSPDRNLPKAKEGDCVVVDSFYKSTDDYYHLKDKPSNGCVKKGTILKK